MQDASNAPDSANRDKTSPPADERQGFGPSQSRINPKWKPYYRRLVELRDEVLTKQHALTNNAREIQPHYAQREPADVAEEDFERDLNLGQVSAEQRLLNEIEAALDRIENGSYGTCELTGKPIPPERLKAVPWTRFTVEAESEIERQGGDIRTAIAPPQSIRPQPRHREAKEGESGTEDHVEPESEKSPDAS